MDAWDAGLRCGHSICRQHYIDTGETECIAEPECGFCEGPLELLGTLGQRAHYRCRNCGLDCSREV